MSAQTWWADRGRDASDEATAPKRKLRLLLAEDDEPFRTLLAQYLRKNGADVVEAHSGADLIDTLGGMVVEAWPRDAVDAIVTDIRMPGMTGLEIVQELRNSGWNMPVVLITAFGDAATHRKAKRLGAEVLDKPFQLRELLVAVARVMDEVDDDRKRTTETGKDPERTH